MKKILFSALILSLLLATLTACGAEAQQPTTPEPAPKIEQSEPVAKPEPLAASEKTEISQEELEPIFEKVFAEVSENHPENWSVDFQITDEIGKITKAIPEEKKAPANLREIYIEWRTAKTQPDTTEPEPEPIPEPEPEPVPQQPATSKRQETPSSTSSETQSPSSSQDDLGSSDDWRQNMRTDVEGFIDPAGGSYNDPDAQSGSIGGSTQSSTVSETTSETPTASTSEGTPDPYGLGITVPPGHHIEPAKNGKYKLVNDETGHFQMISGDKMDGYIAGAGQLTVDEEAVKAEGEAGLIIG